MFLIDFMAKQAQSLDSEIIWMAFQWWYNAAQVCISFLMFI